MYNLITLIEGQELKQTLRSVSTILIINFI